MTEEWREIRDNFKGYWVSSLGRVRSPKRGLLTGHVVHRCGRPSYIIITIKHEGISYARSVHRLVLKAFVGECPPGMEGCHNDGNALNNCVENLRWDTHKANTADSMRHGTFVSVRRQPRGVHPALRGETNPRAQITNDQARKIKADLAAGVRQCDLARELNVAKHLIAHIALGRSWKWLGTEAKPA